MHKYIRTERIKVKKWTYNWPMLWLVWDCETNTYYTDGAESTCWSEEIARLDLRWLIFWIILIIGVISCNIGY